MLTNVPPTLVRMEPSAPTLTETTSVLVTIDLLERTAIKVCVSYSTWQKEKQFYFTRNVIIYVHMADFESLQHLCVLNQ